MAGPEPTVSQTAPTTERLQTVPGFDSKSSGQGQNMSTGGFRSSSVPSEDEVSQLYPNEGEGGQVSALSTAPTHAWSLVLLAAASLDMAPHTATQLLVAFLSIIMNVSEDMKQGL